MGSADNDVNQDMPKALRREQKKRIKMVIHGKSMKALPAKGVPNVKKHKMRRFFDRKFSITKGLKNLTVLCMACNYGKRGTSAKRAEESLCKKLLLIPSL